MKKLLLVLVLGVGLVTVGCSDDTGSLLTEEEDASVTTPGTEGGGGLPNIDTVGGIPDPTEDTTTGPAPGKLGGPCFPNGTCDVGLECIQNICEEAPTPDVGTEGGPCYDNGTCNAGLSCIDGICVEPKCIENNCSSDLECAQCPFQKNICLIAENRCVACIPGTSEGCDDGQVCNSFGICEEEKPDCPADATGSPTVTCNKNSDCSGCGPMYQVCDPVDKKCKGCTNANTSHCLITDHCDDGECAPNCPYECTVDGDCSACEIKGKELKACYSHKCAECSLTYPCASGLECIKGVCLPGCGISGPVSGTCLQDSDCMYCGGNADGELNANSWKCNGLAVNDPGDLYGKCGPPASGCSDLGQGVVLLPPPYDGVTQACSNDNDCNNVGITYNVGALLKDVVGESVLGVDIQDAGVFYPMAVCADVEINAQIDCGICVPCETDSDCSPISLDPILVQLLGSNIVAQLATQFLLTQLYGSGVNHDLHFFCQPVGAGYGVCAPCSNPSQSCGSSGGPVTGGGDCNHNVCESGGPLAPSCGACAEAVCNADSYCCDTNWDDICVGLVEPHCAIECDGGTATTSCDHSPCQTGNALDPQCGSCVEQVCDEDPWCCNNTWDWDASCVDTAEGISACGCVGGNVGDCAHDECVSGDELVMGCSDCATAVCLKDPYCCNPNGSWDSKCIECAKGGETPAGVSCADVVFNCDCN